MLAAMVRALPIGVVFVIRSRRLPSGDWWWRAGVLGVLNIGAFFALLFEAAFRLPGGVAATAGALQPLIASGLAAVIIGERFTRRSALAGFIGMIGVALLAPVLPLTRSVSPPPSPQRCPWQRASFSRNAGNARLI